MTSKAWINGVLIACFVLSIIVAILEYVHTRSLRRAIVLVVAVAVLGITLNITTGFPYVESRQAFGGSTSPFFAVTMMFLGVVLGIIATYVFSMTGAFSWRD